VAVVVSQVGSLVYCDFGTVTEGLGGAGGAVRVVLLRWCAVIQVQWSALQLVMSAIVLVAVLKMGGEFVHPIGSVSGNAMVGPSLLIEGSTTLSFGMLGIERLIQ